MTLAASMPAPVGITTDQQRRRVGWSAFLGTTIEYYDFTLYGLMGPVVFGKLFFPQSDPSTALIAVLAIYAVGFFGRPLGGFVFSHYGDRLGRKPMMIISMTVMGLASTAMGLLPGYASIGVWAPVLLLVLRTVQGFALGGEFAGANVLSTEVAPHGRRGFFTSLVTSGIFVAWRSARRLRSRICRRMICSRGVGGCRSSLRSCWCSSEFGCELRLRSWRFLCRRSGKKRRLGCRSLS